MSSFILAKAVSAFLLPPLSLIVPALAGLLLWHRRPRLARGLLTASVAFLWILSTPAISGLMLRSLEGGLVPPAPVAQPADAIVILGSGSYPNAPEYGTDTASEPGLSRLRYAAKLHRDTGLPILITGGSPQGTQLSEAQQMQNVLEQEFHAPVKWIEGTSNNTAENASLSRPILQQAGIRRIYLVTHAWHMPRAARMFRDAGFEVIPAPTQFHTATPLSILDFLPEASALQDSQRVMHEIIGILWYRLKS